jgi:peptidyl-Asp metalloendopeptidase
MDTMKNRTCKHYLQVAAEYAAAFVFGLWLGTILGLTACVSSPGIPVGSTDAMQECVELTAPTTSTLKPHAKGLVMAPRESGAVIDVAVLWSTKAELKGGGLVKMQAFAAACVADTNTVLSNSLCRSRLRLVYAGPANYAETGKYANDLNALCTGQIPAAVAVDNQYAPDLISLIEETLSVCGSSYSLSSIGSPSTYSRFNINMRSCAVGQHSFAHETGHCFGFLHDHQNTLGTGIAPDAFGYRTPDRLWRDTMAYNPGYRLAYYSTPLKTKSGLPMGKLGYANCARVLNSVTSATVASWRLSKTP